MPAALCTCQAEIISIQPEKAVIVLPAATNDAKMAKAAAELSKHLRLITSVEIETVSDPGKVSGKYPLYVGIPNPDDNKPFAPEEARWTITPGATWLYGDANNGTLFAVYGFLEGSLGFRWVEPGNRGIVCSHRERIVLETGRTIWRPAVGWQLRTKDARERLWNDRLRRPGQYPGYAYGHAYGHWWDKYKDKYPDIFALNSRGDRLPAAQHPKYDAGYLVTLCMSNPKVADLFIEEWEAGGRRECLNTCDMGPPNREFCRCDNCRKLDAAPPGVAWETSLTDRHIWLLNRVAERANAVKNGTLVSFYAIPPHENPPLRENVSPQALIVLVPTSINLERVRQAMESWRKAGARRFMIRPFYHRYIITGGIPPGYERHFHALARLFAVEYGVKSFDFDSLLGNWAIDGFCNYTLARTLHDPDMDFDRISAEYCSAFGAASEEARQYYAYWQDEVWQKRILPDLDAIVERGMAHNYGRGLLGSLGQYYGAEDFDKTDAILQAGLKKNLAPAARERLERQILVNRHARLVLQAAVSEPPEKFKFTRELAEFRRVHEGDLELNMPLIRSVESGAGDIAGAAMMDIFDRYDPPCLKTPRWWHFKLDENNTGESDKWQELDAGAIGRWERAPTDAAWENIPGGGPAPSSAMREKLKSYDGFAWYAVEIELPREWEGREVSLYFGAVDESAWVYVNGKKAGEHVYTKANDWFTPFVIRIDQAVDWGKPRQLVTVRVEDKAGGGGIWRPVWIISRKQEAAMN